ncbi:hypothetical protein D3C71_1909550 [compost metagenome]
MRGQIAHIAHDAEGGCAKRCHGVVHGPLPPPQNRDARALGDKGLGRGKPDAAVAARDDGCFSCKLLHVYPFIELNGRLGA